MIFHLMKYIGDDTELQTLYNDHFGYTSGDPLFWEDYATSPIFPVDEQPESDDFYILYNYRDTFKEGTWWHLLTDARLNINSNDVALIESVSKRLREMFKDYEFAAQRLNVWMGQQSLEGYIVNYTRYHSSGIIEGREQENGIHRRNIRVVVNSTEC